MVLVGVGEHDADEIGPLFLEVGDVRKDEVDTGKIGARKGDAEVDREPGARLRRPVAVEPEIHADLADPAKRKEDQLVPVRARRHQRTVAVAPK